MKTEYLRISTRGSNLFQQTLNQTCAVKLPIGLRNRGPCIIDCLYSTTEMISLPLDTTVLEVGLSSNINISGYDTHTSGNNFTAGGCKTLAIYDLDNEIRTNGTHDRKLTTHGTKYPFYRNALRGGSLQLLLQLPGNARNSFAAFAAFFAAFAAFLQLSYSFLTAFF